MVGFGVSTQILKIALLIFTHCELGELASPGVVDRAALTMRIKASASFRSTDIRDAISKQLASIMICNKYLNRAEKYAIFRTLHILKY